MAFTSSIPLVDLAPFRGGTEAGRAATAHAVADACAKFGFLVLEGHGVAQGTLDAMIDAVRRFFSLPETTKLRSLATEPGVVRGFSRMATRSLAKLTGAQGLGDLREAFTCNRVQDKSDPYFTNPAAGKFFASNIWPDERDVPGFERAFTDYYLALDRVAADLMRVFALALDLPEFFFMNKIDKHFSNLTAFYYPPLEREPPPGQLRGGAHTDFGSTTFVYAHPSARGLQVWDGADWCDVPVVPGTFVVNLGDLMAQWTNDRWVSTMHRVANPVGEEARVARYSIAFFHQPNYDALIESLDSEHPAKYPPVTSGDHLRRKIAAMRA